MKKLPVLTLAATLSLSTLFVPGISHAKDSIDSGQSIQSESEEQYVIKKAEDYKEMAEKSGLNPDKVVGGVRILKSDSSTDNIQTLEVGGYEWEIKNASVTDTTGNYISRDIINGPFDFSNTYTTKLTTKVSADVHMDVNGIGGALGAEYVESKQFSKSYSIHVPKGHTYRIYAFPLFNSYSFELYENDPANDDYYGWQNFEEPTGIYVTWEEL